MYRDSIKAKRRVGSIMFRDSLKAKRRRLKIGTAFILTYGCVLLFPITL